MAETEIVVLKLVVAVVRVAVVGSGEVALYGQDGEWYWRCWW